MNWLSGRWLRALVMVAVAAVSVGLLSGCVLSPRGTSAEKKRLKEAGQAYQQPVEKRNLPELSDSPTWRDVLRRAFLANGDLEAAYFEWEAAVHRIDMNATWPNSNLQIGFEYMFSDENMKAWDRTTISGGFDPSMTLSLPNKVARAGRVSLAEAQAAAEQFRAKKFDLQKQVLSMYLDLALAEQRVRIQRDNVALLRVLEDATQNAVRAGRAQQDLLKVRIERELAENELANARSEARSIQASLNAMLARDPQSPLSVPTLPEPRELAADDATLIATGIDRNPELASLARQVQGRKDALELARLAYLPDVAPAAGFTGSVSQFVGAMVMVPTTIPMIRAKVQEARAMLQSTQAVARQARHDRAAQFVAALYVLRNAERQAQLFDSRILPASRAVLASVRQAYAAGQADLLDLIDSQRTLLEVQLLVAEARVQREKQLAELEALAGVDVETLGRESATRPATQPTTNTSANPSAPAEKAKDHE
ncbi:TolC family protein [Fontivita pretiosa]|uniref:TolC family protein n=1 Tax=Fontivita pretiosa TaxID=2989684 RepID=UPI003D163145